MKRPNRSPGVFASIAGLALVVSGCSGLDGSQPPPTAATGPAAPGQATSPAPPSQAASPAATTAAAIDPSACAIDQAPGPADAPPNGGGDLVDTADFGPGRFRLCLTAPTTVAVEGTAWCVWSPDRSAVTEVNGLPTAVGGGPRIAGDIGVDPPRLEIEATSAQGDVSTFGNAGDRRIVQADPDHRSGVAAFVVTEVVDPEHPPQVGQQPRSGFFRWACGEAPVPRPS